MLKFLRCNFTWNAFPYFAGSVWRNILESSVALDKWEPFLMCMDKYISWYAKFCPQKLKLAKTKDQKKEAWTIFSTIKLKQRFWIGQKTIWESTRRTNHGRYRVWVASFTSPLVHLNQSFCTARAVHWIWFLNNGYIPRVCSKKSNTNI